MSYAMYEQSNGRFSILDIEDGGQHRVVYETTGYAGRGRHKNRPESEYVRGFGPLPVGEYRIGKPYTSAKVGPLALPLTRVGPTSVDPYGRAGFVIHGDSIRRPGEASSGCIIIHREGREAVIDARCERLVVLSGPVPASPPQGGNSNITK